MIGPASLWHHRRFWYVGLASLAFNALLLALALPLNAQSPETKTPVKLVAFGDSLTAGYLLKPEDSFPAQLSAALKATGYAVDVVNAGVSGDTTAAGLERFDWAVPPGTEAVILELGANDALRGQPPAAAKANLETIITRLKERNTAILLAGMRAPSNWGPEYQREFDAMFEDLAAKHNLILYPFFLDGVALDKSLNLDDGLHPNGKGVARIVEQMMPKVEELLKEVGSRRANGPPRS